VASLYERILEIGRNFMGAAAEDYLRRRIRIVLHGGKPESIEPDRLDRLAAGIEMTARGYMSAPRAQQFVEEILTLKDSIQRKPP
jgi:hypothetical protein